MDHAVIFHFIGSSLANPATTPLAIVVATVILEDAATVGAGVLAADHHIGIAVALAALVAGVLLTDFTLYWIGRLAITHPRLGAWVKHEKVAPIRGWLHDHPFSTVISARCLPGVRLPTYLACGFFGVPFSRFAAPALIATLVWTPLLFTLSYLFGVYTFFWLGLWRWPIALAAVLALVIIGRHHWNQVLAKAADAGIHTA